MVPVNVTRGVVTLERVRGTIEIYFDVAELTSNLDNWFVHMSLQLVPARDGAVDAASALSCNNAADQESNRIIWQRLYTPDTGGTITSPGPLERHTSVFSGQEVDVKSKRRFDRSTWALALVYVCDNVADGIHLFQGNMRALFRSSDSL